MRREDRLAKNETFFREANDLTEQDEPGWNNASSYASARTAAASTA